MKLEIKNTSSLEKIMPKQSCDCMLLNSASVLKNEIFSYQIAFKSSEILHCSQILHIEIESDLEEFISISKVRAVPVITNKYCDEPDDNYISQEAGIFPDVLEPYEGYVTAYSHNYTALWVDVKTNVSTNGGIHKIKIKFVDDEKEVWGISEFSLDIIDVELPKSDIPYTNWFHCDCIASYHNCEVFSEQHWKLIDNYMKVATENGMNMILTPIFTPPLDTKVGAERPTVQLVDVFLNNGVYTFGFEKLLRWFELCRKNNIEYIEISHLFSQWGAEKTPKIVVWENGKEIKKFGWHTDAMSNEYKEFLTQFIPALKEILVENWDKDKVYFHISDEPNEKHIEFYGEIYKFFKPLIGEFKQMDAISDYELYEKKFIETPVVATNAVNDFLDKGIDNLWVYYCCVQGSLNLSNRFIAMPSYRNRIMGLQLYKYDIKGFLQWGYNFYYSQFSMGIINPYLVNDADGAFPAGDAFSVYPYRDGALPSIRLKVFGHGLQDMRALKLLERYIGRDKVMECIKDVKDFNHYPQNSEYLINLRENINDMIRKHCVEH